MINQDDLHLDGTRCDSDHKWPINLRKKKNWFRCKTPFTRILVELSFQYLKVTVSGIMTYFTYYFWSSNWNHLLLELIMAALFFLYDMKQIGSSVNDENEGASGRPPAEW